MLAVRDNEHDNEATIVGRQASMMDPSLTYLPHFAMAYVAELSDGGGPDMFRGWLEKCRKSGPKHVSLGASQIRFRVSPVLLLLRRRYGFAFRRFSCYCFVADIVSRFAGSHAIKDIVV